jgi:GNAT superfamily N-acetyltransferase
MELKAGITCAVSRVDSDFRNWSPDLHVRPASPGELGMAFAMLPHVANQEVLPESVFIAEWENGRGILGVGAFSIVPVDICKPGVRGDIFVLPTFRRRGIGGAILSVMKKSLRDWGVGYLHAWQPVELVNEKSFLSKMGFLPLKAVFQFESETGKTCAAVKTFLARRKSGKYIPSGAELIPLLCADRIGIIRLYSNYFACLEHRAQQHFERTLSSELCAQLSFALALHGRVIGFISWKLDGQGLPAIDLWITMPPFRTGWPGIALLEASTERLAKLGYPHVRFECNEEASVTLHIARLLDARLAGTVAGHAINV